MACWPIKDQSHEKKVIAQWRLNYNKLLIKKVSGVGNPILQLNIKQKCIH